MQNTSSKQYLLIIITPKKFSTFKGFIECSLKLLQSILNLTQVSMFREMMGLPKNDKMAHVDAYGLKVLFNHGLRRFMTGAKNRVPRLNSVLVPLYA